jgi:hypothetical protein
MLVVAGMLVAAARAEADRRRFGVLGLAIVLAILFAGLATTNCLAGIGLLRLRHWSRALQLVTSALWLCAVPLGTLIGAVVLVYLSMPGTVILLSGRSPSDLSSEEHAAVQRVSIGGKGFNLVFVALLTLAVALIILIAFVAAPALTRQ